MIPDARSAETPDGAAGKAGQPMIQHPSPGGGTLQDALGPDPVLACSIGRGTFAHVMPARDGYHDQVRQALERDGWTITHDPLRLKVRRRKLYVDLGAERVLAAEKGVRKIAIEIKMFSGPSDVRDLEDAVGQFVLYEHALRREDPDRSLYLAVSEATWQLVFKDALGEILIDDHVLRVVTFDPTKQEIVRWIP
jgi:hypothetical protein